MKIKKSTLIVFLFSIILKGATAQLSGNYTVGGTNPSYPTLQAAATALQAGVTGPVIFNIRPGTYNEKVLMGNVPGTSTTNTITFKSQNNDSTSVVVSDPSSAQASNNFVFLVNGTDYLTIRNITIERTGTEDYNSVINIGGGSKHFELRNCIVTASPSTGSQNSIVEIPLAAVGDSMTTFDNNIFTGCFNGIKITGQSIAASMPLPQITNNTFTDQTASAIQIKNASGAVIRNNTISTNTTDEYYAIYLWRVQRDFEISFNKVSGITDGSGILLDTCLAISGDEGMILNNFIATEGSGNANGIIMAGCNRINVYYNTVHVSTTGADNAALYLSGSDTATLNIRNNIFVNSDNGYAYYFENGMSSNFTLDYNDVYSTGAVLALIDTNVAFDLSELQTLTSDEDNSVSADPQFVSSTDLHAGDPAVNNSGVHIAGITTDIDGQTRSGSTPDIGADEFTPLSDNIGVIGIVSPVTGDCGDSLTTIGVVIRNFGVDPQTGFPLHADITGDITQNLTTNYTSTIGSGETDTLYFTTTINTYSGSAFDIMAFSSFAGDQFRNNDTTRGSFQLGSHPAAPLVVNPQTQCDNNPLITLAVDSTTVLFWYANVADTDPLYVGNVFSPSISTDTTFYAEAHSTAGGVGCLRITEIQPAGSADYLEIQNLSSLQLDATGWKVYISDDYSLINEVNVLSWDLGVFAAGEVQSRSDDSGDPNYWGNNIFWDPSAASGGWAMIVDDQGMLVDFLGWNWDSTEIQSLNIVVNTFNITVGSEWSGAGFVPCTGGNTSQRIGSDDHNDASDIGCDVSSEGIANTNLSPVFTHCGVGLCGSERVAVDVVLVAGINPVNLGNDTIVSGAISVPLDAGPGYTTYLWSNGDTTQTTLATAAGIYIVTVTGGANGCSFSDTISISSPVGISPLIGADEFSFYPNPSTDRLILSSSEEIMKSAIVRITDLQGREAKGVDVIKNSSNEYLLNLNSLNEGVYFLQILSGERKGVKKFVVVK